MNKLNKLPYIMLAALLFLSSCMKLNRVPETDFSDANFWNTESDLQEACNRLYNQLAGYGIDNRADDSFGNTGDQISNGSRSVPSTSNDWSSPYDNIFTANNILEKGLRAVNVAESVRNRYFGEARFFRAYYYLQLVEKYGDVPLVTKTLDVNDPELLMPRTSRAIVMDTIFSDLDYAAKWLPRAANLPAADYGRVTQGAALALKARAALYEGTFAKFHGTDEDASVDLQIAADAATSVMNENYYGLFNSYANMFQHEGDGPQNKENVFVKVYGSNAIVDGTDVNPIVTHDNSRNMENGRFAPTRNLLVNYLCTDGLPWGQSPLTEPESSYNAFFANRDPRLNMTVYEIGDTAYKGTWVPTTTAQRTGYACRKGYNQADWDNLGKATVDKALIRYAEVLLIYAEAKYEISGSISDADLDKSINKIRDRVNMPQLTNPFVIANNLDMRTEIRRERTVELALEGFRYDDVIRWKTAETLMPKGILGAKFIASEWPDTKASDLNLNADSLLIVEPAAKRAFKADKDYLYPVPLNEISLSKGNVTQNPNW
ncbi:RagB/SusD family nutrient uptake outer membrane protein [Arachidicoccus sp.]|uniref:RagB/SusD family nutrient uptake outer membrane protein n=1 Tax=Arachidicoccus sp. TaxID=1872624 RepID=UPI003D1A3BDF